MCVDRAVLTVDDQADDDREPDSRVLAAVAGPGRHHQLGAGPAIGDAALAAWVLQRERAADARLIGIEAQDHDVVRGRHERLATMADACAPILHGGDRGVQVEPAAVCAHGRLPMVELHRQVAGRLVAARGDARAEEMALTVAFRIEVAAGVQQAPELRDMEPRVRLHGRHRRAGPDRLFVEQHLIARGATVDHGAHATVAERQGGAPAAGGTIPVGDRPVELRRSVVPEAVHGAGGSRWCADYALMWPTSSPFTK